MKNRDATTAQQRKREWCPLCQRHQKLKTGHAVDVWVEFDVEGQPLLCMDSTSTGGGLNSIWIDFCPICGRKCGKLPEQEAEYGEA